MSSDTLRAYFSSFESKDLNGTVAFLSERVHLTDWTGDYVGKQSVSKYMLSVFHSAPSLGISVTDIFSVDDFWICFLVVRAGASSTRVIDVVKFDMNGFIESVQAFRGTEFDAT